jgi:predicted metal-binding membrane protein
MTDGVNPRRNRVESLRSTNVLRTLTMSQGRAFVPVWVFLGGYLVLWTAFSLAATLAQWGLHSLALISPMMVGTSPLLGSLLLITAGVYQWTPVKQACLRTSF